MKDERSLKEMREQMKEIRLRMDMVPGLANMGDIEEALGRVSDAITQLTYTIEDLLED